MPTRRETLIAISAAAVPIPVTAQQSQLKPKFLTEAEFALTAKLVDLILPRTDTPGASDANVHGLIDDRAQSDKKFAAAWRGVLKKMSAGDPADAVEREYRAKSAEFKLLKNTAIDLYYSTREGLRDELGWNANTYLPEFKGCNE